MAIVALTVTSANATLIKYQQTFTVVDDFEEGDPLGIGNAQFAIEYVWDPDLVTPTFDAPSGSADRLTLWPDTNTTFELVISGSTGGADGTYFGASTGSSWAFFDNDLNGARDLFSAPKASFNIGGTDIEINSMAAQFAPSFVVPDAPGTVFPFTFVNSDVTFWEQPSIKYASHDANSVGVGMFGSAQSSQDAAAVPAPAGITIAGLLALVGFLRRQESVQ